MKIWCNIQVIIYPLHKQFYFVISYSRLKLIFSNPIFFQSKIKHDNSVDIDKLAKMTVGFSGADLENMVNTAAIRAAVDGESSS